MFYLLLHGLEGGGRGGGGERLVGLVLQTVLFCRVFWIVDVVCQSGSELCMGFWFLGELIDRGREK